MSEPYDADDEIRKRAMAEIAEIAEAHRLRLRPIGSFRSESPSAVLRREFLKHLADEYRNRMTASPTPSHPQETARAPGE